MAGRIWRRPVWISRIGRWLAGSVGCHAADGIEGRSVDGRPGPPRRMAEPTECTDAGIRGRSGPLGARSDHKARGRTSMARARVIGNDRAVPTASSVPILGRPSLLVSVMVVWWVLQSLCLHHSFGLLPHHRSTCATSGPRAQQQSGCKPCTVLPGWRSWGNVRHLPPWRHR